MTGMSFFRWKPSCYQNETSTKNEIKTWSVKPVRGKRQIKRRGFGGREVTISVRGKIKKMGSHRKNERDLVIYTEQMLYLQKLVFNMRV